MLLLKILLFASLLLFPIDARVLKQQMSKSKGKSSGSMDGNVTSVSCYCQAAGVNVSHQNCFHIPGSVVVCEPSE